MSWIVTALVASLAGNAALAVLWKRKRSVTPTIKSADFDLDRCEPIAVAIRVCEEGFYLANPETGKKLEFVGCTAWSGHLAPQLGKAAIHFCDIPVWPGHEAPHENIAEVLLEHVPLMN